jgi:hypothetical protein
MNNRQIIISLQRLRLYHDRVQDAVVANDPVAGMAHAAELAEISRRLWDQFEQEAALAPSAPVSSEVERVEGLAAGTE